MKSVFLMLFLCNKQHTYRCCFSVVSNIRILGCNCLPNFLTFISELYVINLHGTVCKETHQYSKQFLPGLTPTTDSRSLLRALLESIAFNMKLLQETMEEESDHTLQNIQWEKTTNRNISFSPWSNSLLRNSIMQDRRWRLQERLCGPTHLLTHKQEDSQVRRRMQRAFIITVSRVTL